MNNAELYQSNNSVQKRDALLYLEEFASRLRWKNSNNRILDVGSGDGSVTAMLKKFIPTSYRLLGCDISEKMVNHANDHHCNEHTSFTVLDIAGEIPDGMKGNFDHVFSFYTLHWVLNHESAFNNIYNLLDKEGECFTIFVASAPVYDVYRKLAKNNKWAELMQDLDQYISPYHDSEDPAKDLRTIMENIGYVDIDVECRKMVYIYESVPILKKAMSAINPFKVPEEKYEDFMEDYVQILREMNIVVKINNSDEETVRFNYDLMVAFARKSSREKY